MKQVSVMEGEKPKTASAKPMRRGSKAASESFEEVWKLIEEVRSDPECMRALRKLIKYHTS